VNEEASGQIFFSIAFDFIGENKNENKILKKGTHRQELLY
jgi:hypothetical protein